MYVGVCVGVGVYVYVCEHGCGCAAVLMDRYIFLTVSMIEFQINTEMCNDF